MRGHMTSAAPAKRKLWKDSEPPSCVNLEFNMHRREIPVNALGNSWNMISDITVELF